MIAPAPTHTDFFRNTLFLKRRPYAKCHVLPGPTDAMNFFLQSSSSCSEGDDDGPLKIVKKACLQVSLADSSSESEPEPLEVPDTRLRKHPIDDAPLEMHIPEREAIVPFPHANASGSSWKPGLNCGEFVGRVGKQSLSAQSQVLICNTLANLEWLPRVLQKACLQALRPTWLEESSKQSFSARLAGYILGLPAITVQTVRRAVKRSGWLPDSLHADQTMVLCFFP